MSGSRDRRGVVVVGHPRSGTTLLRRLLNAHPAIASPPETHLLSACARFLAHDLTADGVDMGVLAGLHFAGFTDAEVLEKLRGFAFSFLQEFARREGKPRWAEKTAFDIFHLPTIETLCGDEVAYLGIIRHPLDVAVSCLDFCQATGVYPAPMHAYIQRYAQPVEAFVRSWLDTTEMLIELGGRRPKEMIICRYEDLVDAPEQTMADLFSFLGEDASADVVNRALGHKGCLGFSDHKSYQVNEVHVSSRDRWRRLPAPQIARLSHLVNPMLEKCGYDTLQGYEEIAVQGARQRYEVSLAVHANRARVKEV